MCGHLQRWFRTFGNSFCDNCVDPFDNSTGYIDFREFLQPLVEVDDEEGLDAVTNLVDPEKTGDLDTAKFHEDFGSVDRGAIFELAIRMATCAQRVAGLPHRNVALDPTHIAQAGRTLLGWPNRFYEWVETVTASEAGANDHLNWVYSPVVKSLRRDPTIHPRLRELMNQALAAKAAKDVINYRRETVPDLARENQATTQVGGLHFGGEWVGTRFGGPQFVRKLKTTPKLFPSDIDLVTRVLRHDKASRAIASGLGLPAPHLIALYDAGFLPELEPLLCDIRIRPSTRISELGRRLIARGAKNRAFARLSVIAAVSLLTKRSDPPWDRVLHAILEGTLSVGLSIRDSGSVLSRLRTDDLEMLTSLCAEYDTTSIADVPLTRAEAAMTMGRKIGVVSALHNAGFVSSNPTNREINALRADWAFSFEIKEFAAVGIDEIETDFKILRKSTVRRKSFGGYQLWSRNDLKELACEIHS